jgi:multidrug efflux pump subunit AcrB
MFGNDYRHLITVSEAIQDKLAAYPELYNIRDNINPGTPELRIYVDPDRAAKYGLSTQEVGRYIRASFDGVTATKIFAQNEEMEVIVKFSRIQQNSLLDILQLSIPTRSGRFILFSSVAEVRESTPFGAIKRLDGKREVTITAEATNEENVRKINADIQRLFDKEFQARYPEIKFTVGGEFAEFNNLLSQILRIFLIGLFLIYAILGTQFKSYAQPILILFSVPFAFVGVILYLLVSGTPFSTTIMYAGVAVAGSVLTSAICRLRSLPDHPIFYRPVVPASVRR